MTCSELELELELERTLVERNEERKVVRNRNWNWIGSIEKGGTVHALAEEDHGGGTYCGMQLRPSRTSIMAKKIDQKLLVIVGPPPICFAIVISKEEKNHTTLRFLHFVPVVISVSKTKGRFMTGWRLQLFAPD